MCWLSIYFEISSSFLVLVALIDDVVSFRSVTPVDLVVGTSLNSQHVPLLLYI